MTALAMSSSDCAYNLYSRIHDRSNCTNSRNQAWTSQYRNTSCTGFIWTKGSSICADRANPSWKACFGGQMISFFYSLSGGILCWLVMSLISALLKKKFLVLISMCGAAAHNIGQILAAIVITHSISVVAYLPVLMLSAMITGFFTGLAARCVQRDCKRF